MGSLLQHTGSFTVACRLFIAARGLFSSCGTPAQQCGAGAPEHMGSVIVAHALSSRGSHAQ